MERGAEMNFLEAYKQQSIEDQTVIAIACARAGGTPQDFCGGLDYLWGLCGKLAKAAIEDDLDIMALLNDCEE